MLTTTEELEKAIATGSNAYKKLKSKAAALVVTINKLESEVATLKTKVATPSTEPATISADAVDAASSRRRLISAPHVPATPCLEPPISSSLVSVTASIGAFLFGGILLRHCLR